MRRRVFPPLIEGPKKGWRPSGNLWSYSHAIRAQKNAKPKQEEKKESSEKPAQAALGYYMTGVGGAAVIISDDCKPANRPGPWVAPRSTTLFSEPQPTGDDNVVTISHTNTISKSTKSVAGNTSPGFVTYSLSSLDKSFCYSFSLQAGRVDGEWIADSGASKSLAGDGTALIAYEEYALGEAPCRFSCSNGEQGVPQGHGIALMRLDNGKNDYTDLMVHIRFEVQSLGYGRSEDSKQSAVLRERQHHTANDG